MTTLLSHDETLELIRQAQQGNMEARQLLVERNTPLVKSLVRRFTSCSAEYEDLYQIGCLGLIKSILHYDEQFHVRFSTYAVPMIAGEIKRHLRDDGAIKVSRSLKENALRAKTTADRLRSELQREPTIDELAQEMDINREDLVMCLDSLRAPVSIFEPIYEDDSSPVLLMDVIANEEGELGVTDRILLRDAISTLDPQERKVVMLRFFKNKTQVEIGRMLGMSQVQVSRLEQKIIKKMRKMCCEA